MARITMELRVNQRYWCAAMLAIGAFAIQLGADEEKICAWIVKYAIKLELIRQ